MNNSIETLGNRNSHNDLHLLDAFLESLSVLASQANDRNEFYQSLAKNILSAADANGVLIAAIFPNSRSSIVQNVFQSVAKADESDCLALVSDSEFKIDEGSATRFVCKKTLPSGRDCFVAQAKTPAEFQIRFLLVRESSTSETLDSVFADLVEEIANIIQAFEEKWSLRKVDARSKSANHFAALALNVASSTSVREMYFHLANDLGVFTGAGRVCVFDSAGKIRACSGVSAVSRRSPTIRELGRLARTAANRNQCLEFRSGVSSHLSRHDQQQMEKVAEANGCDTIIVAPLREKRTRLVSVSFEFFDSEQSDKLEQQAHVQFATQAVQAVLARQKRFSSIPFLNLWVWFFHDVIRRPLRHLIGLALIATFIVGGFMLLSNSTRTFEIPATGQLMPEHRRNVFASGRGNIDKILIDEGDHVILNQDAMIIRSIDLEQELSKTNGELAEAHQQLSNLQLLDLDKIDEGSVQALDPTEISSQIETQKIRITTLNKKLEFLKQKSEQLVVRCPFDGQIVSRDLQQNLRFKPVERGELLFTVAKVDAPWIVELEIDEKYNAYLVKQLQRETEGLTVRFRVSSDPARVFTGTLKKLNYLEKSAIQVDGKQLVSAEIEFDKSELGDLLRIGTGVNARIECGERSYLFLLTYELNDKIRSWLFFGSPEGE